MQNKDIAASFKLMSKLLELHHENPFRIKSYQNAASQIENCDQNLFEASFEQINTIKGIGKGIASKILELRVNGSFAELDDLLEKTPSGILEVLSLKGLGPKKVATLWKQLNIESIGELLYACQENRLIELAGFGVKTQETIVKNIEFKLSARGWFHFANAEQVAFQIIKYLEENLPGIQIALTGEIRRKCEIIKTIDILIGDEKKYLQLPENQLGIQINLLFCKKEDFYFKLCQSSASEIHLQQLMELGFNSNKVYKSEQEIYHSLGLQYIEPELREGIDEIQKAKLNLIPNLIDFQDLKGVFHVHTTYSDGIHTLKQMAEHCRDLGYQYLGVTDHSQSAFYANGLSSERIFTQHIEIDELNKSMTPFKIFKGVESDILNDGSLDYPEEILKKFDFIIASIHSNLKMDKLKATDRLIKAIQNPYTTILGHPTGRLLLSREGYPIDHKAVIDACAESRVIIELNSHPFRLDLDWRWINYAIEKSVYISINPDAHKADAVSDMKYGINIARKSFLTKEFTFNAWSSDLVSDYIEQRKNNRFQNMVSLD